MSEAAQFSIGADVVGSDTTCGRLVRVVVDPVARALTHLVVEPANRRGLGRLVPVALVDTAGEQIHLRCTAAQFEGLEVAEETQFLPVGDDEWGYGSGQALMWPYYGLGVEGMGAGMGMMGVGNAPQPVMHDRVPLGEVQVRRGDRVHASDGDIGAVQGLIIDPRDHHVTHVLLQEGHLWGRKQVAIPIMAVASVDDGIRVELTKQEIKDLPPVDLTSTS